VQLLYDVNYPYLDIEDLTGVHCLFSVAGKELFRGMCLTQDDTDGGNLTIKACDRGYWLANNRDTFAYKNHTAAQVFRDICARFSLSGTADDTGYVIPSIKLPAATAWDALQNAMAATWRATGRRYYVLCEQDRLRLIRRVDNTVRLVLEPGANLISYRRSLSLENVRTRVKIVNYLGSALSTQMDVALEAKIGILQDVERAEKGLPPAQYRALAQKKLAEVSRPKMTLSVEALGDADVITGKCAHLILPGRSGKSYYVEEDMQTFDGAHTMRLQLIEVAEEYA
jgi:hypothetical protein